jgi:transposase
MLQRQTSLPLSAYSDLYDVVVPQDHPLRKMKDLIDFDFIYDELMETYTLNYGRTAIDPVRMFKYLVLKSMYPLSDADLVERSKYDMSFKYFLGMAPEESVIHSSSLTKFRKMRLKDLDLLDLLIGKTFRLPSKQAPLQVKRSLSMRPIRKLVITKRNQRIFFKNNRNSYAKRFMRSMKG